MFNQPERSEGPWTLHKYNISPPVCPCGCHESVAHCNFITFEDHVPNFSVCFWDQKKLKFANEHEQQVSKKEIPSFVYKLWNYMSSTPVLRPTLLRAFSCIQDFAWYKRCTAQQLIVPPNNVESVLSKEEVQFHRLEPRAAYAAISTRVTANKSLYVTSTWTLRRHLNKNLCKYKSLPISPFVRQ